MVVLLEVALCVGLMSPSPAFQSPGRPDALQLLVQSKLMHPLELRCTVSGGMSPMAEYWSIERSTTHAFVTRRPVAGHAEHDPRVRLVRGAVWRVRLHQQTISGLPRAGERSSASLGRR